MGDYKDLVIPQVNVNDTKVTISDIQKDNLEYIEEDEMLYCVETSKATEDYYPNYAGYVVLFVEDLDEVEVGKSAGMIFKSLDDAKAKLVEVEAEKEKARFAGCEIEGKNRVRSYRLIRCCKKDIRWQSFMDWMSLVMYDGLIGLNEGVLVYDCQRSA